MPALIGPAMLVAVGYMDPGNWATDIAAGARYGFGLLYVVIAAGLAAILLQSLALRLGMASGLDLARACRQRYGLRTSFTLWLLAETAILATDVAEMLGGALAIKLMLGLPLWTGVLLTSAATLSVVGLMGSGAGRIEAIVGALVATITLCFLAELVISPPDPRAMIAGMVPDPSRLTRPGALALAMGIVGATVMPHNLYLHSGVARVQDGARDAAGIERSIRLATIGTALSLTLAMLVNGAILALAATSFHATSHTQVTSIDDAYRLLEPITGLKTAALLFGIALLASGQSSTITGTIAGQIVLEGFLDLKISPWKRRLIGRAIAVVPALAGVMLLGDGGVGAMLIVSQIVLSLQLPFAVWPLIASVSDETLMNGHQPGRGLIIAAVTIFVIVSGANLWMLVSLRT
ncbi:MAG: divalent metal cation transporter [Sphingomonas sp.]|nr:MAG: divalent metal cation transporter [Sphingomonas sp.]